MSYISAGDLQQYVNNERGVVDQVLLTSAVNAASAAIDRYCRRTFTVAGEEAAAKVFAPNDAAVLYIYDCTTITGITENGATLSSSSWQAEPVNNMDGAGLTVPFSAVRRIDGGRWCQTSGRPGKASISITATWGWAVTPYEVVEACRMVAKEIVDERYNRGGFVVLGEAAGRAMRSRQVAALLDPFRSPRAFGIA